MAVFKKFIALILVCPILAESRCYSRPELKLIAKGNNAFAKDFYLNLVNETHGNIFFSPFSIATAFGMVHLGSKGNTAAELQNVFQYPDDIRSFKIGYNDLMTEFRTETSNYVLKSSNKVYVRQSLPLLENFSNAVTNDFLGVAENANFSQPEIVRQKINSDVEKETNSKIKDLLPEGSIDESTSLVLVNALYFKSSWSTKFIRGSTKDSPFWVSNETSVNVSMMSVEDEFYYAEDASLDAKILKLTYKGEASSFVVILPNKRDGLGELEAKLHNVSLDNLDDLPRKRRVLVKIPKFKLEQRINLPQNLKQLGLVDAFDQGTSDLSGIAGLGNLYISSAEHKAVVEIDEDGTEAAAATSIQVFPLNFIISPTKSFIADHPFLFYIKHERSNSVLFLGRFMKSEIN